MASIVARKFGSKIEAELAAEHLVSEGIDAFVSADDAGGQFPVLQSLEGVSVLVDEASLERAETVLSEQFGPPPVRKAPLSPLRRVQGMAGLLLFAVFILALVYLAATQTR